MRDNLRRYRAIRHAVIQGYPGEPTGHVARRLTTLAALISGIVGSKSGCRENFVHRPAPLRLALPPDATRGGPRCLIGHPRWSQFGPE